MIEELFRAIDRLNETIRPGKPPSSNNSTLSLESAKSSLKEIGSSVGTTPLSARKIQSLASAVNPGDTPPATLDAAITYASELDNVPRILRFVNILSQQEGGGFKFTMGRRPDWL
jgi:hypothetical protein